jgi:hypothetical protein
MLRDEAYQVISELEHVEEAKGVSPDEKKSAKDIAKKLGGSVEYAPTWVRLLSALCLGIGTMSGYRRIVTTLGERLGNVHLTPAQGASAELVSAALIGHRWVHRLAREHDSHRHLRYFRHHGRARCRPPIRYSEAHFTRVDPHAAIHHFGLRGALLFSDEPPVLVRRILL